MSNIKLCTNCRWCRRPGRFFVDHRCLSPQRAGFSPVYGRFPVHRRCEQARSDREDCGLGARWFEPKISWWGRMMRCIKKVPQEGSTMSSLVLLVYAGLLVSLVALGAAVKWKL